MTTTCPDCGGRGYVETQVDVDQFDRYTCEGCDGEGGWEPEPETTDPGYYCEVCEEQIATKWARNHDALAVCDDCYAGEPESTSAYASHALYESRVTITGRRTERHWRKTADYERLCDTIRENVLRGGLLDVDAYGAESDIVEDLHKAIRAAERVARLMGDIAAAYSLTLVEIEADRKARLGGGE